MTLLLKAYWQPNYFFLDSTGLCVMRIMRMMSDLSGLNLSSITFLN